jgi:hypothetical protein
MVNGSLFVIHSHDTPRGHAAELHGLYGDLLE